VQVVDTQQSVRLAILMEMLEEVSRATEPEQAVQAYARRIGRLRPVDAVLSVSVRNMPEGQYKITRRSVSEGSDRVFKHQIVDPWKNWGKLPTFSGGFLGEIIRTPEPRLIHDLDVGDDPVIGEFLSDMGCCLALPLLDGGKALNWAFQFRRDPRGFSMEDLEQNLLTANIFGAVTRNLVSLDQINRLNDRLRQQFEEVARVQQSLLPRQLPSVVGVRFATSYLTSEQAGGDYYDFFQLPGGRLGIVIADVSGHGPGAATVMAMLHAMIHAFPGDPATADPAEIMRFANRQLVNAGMDGSFATAFVGLYEPMQRTLIYTNAGHPAPRVRESASGRVRSLAGESTLPLGITEQMEFPTNRVALQPGQTVVLFTDGVTEVFNDQREMFGLDGLDAAIAQSSDDPESAIDAIHGALHAFNGRMSRDDDQTLVVMRVE
jgi:sigma-B regulation protein RsbU (phosphoserine phosphatase)